MVVFIFYSCLHNICVFHLVFWKVLEFGIVESIYSVVTGPVIFLVLELFGFMFKINHW